MRPLVVKFGGSLLDCAASLVPVLAASPRPILVVPGGGPFADAVRRLDPPDDIAHWMAILAMEEVGLYIASFGLPATGALRVPDAPSVFLPCRVLRDLDPLPHTWQASSDTIAAWCATELESELVLAKSVDGVIVGGRLLKTVIAPVETDAVDACLIPFALKHGLRARIVNARVPGRLAGALLGQTVPGTRIDPSLFERRA